MQKTTTDIDIGDYLKLFACTAVMLQTLLGFVLTTTPSATNEIGIGILYNLIKFTAPAFIFGILYTTARKSINAAISYQRYLGQRWHGLFVPTIWWTAIYLLVTPDLQQIGHYHNLRTFLWQFINGNAAPHLWYNTMMLQFILLMPIFLSLGRWAATTPVRGLITAGWTIAIFLAWILFYDLEVFHGPQMTHWYLLDRVFPSFLIYGVFGVLAWQYHEMVNRFLRTWWPIFCLIFLASFYWINIELFRFGSPIKLINAPYYKPSMVLYDLVVISLIASLAIFQIDNHTRVNKVVHILADFAYRAFLSNVFWLYLLWSTFGKQLVIHHLLIGTAILYAGTWMLSFGSAFIIHFIWQRIHLLLPAHQPHPAK